MKEQTKDFNCDLENKMNFLGIDKEFHLKFARISGNERLFNLLLNLTEQFIGFGLISFKNITSSEDAYREHIEIVEAV